MHVFGNETKNNINKSMENDEQNHLSEYIKEFKRQDHKILSQKK